MRQLVRWLPVGVFALLAFFLWRGLSGDPTKLPSMRVGQPVPDFDLPQLEDAVHARFSSRDLRGQVAVLNVWASWCESCIQEQVFLLNLARQGVPIYGLNYHDYPPAAIEWLHTWGNPYRAIGADTTGEATMNLGVYGTPETFLIDPQGVIRFRYAGALDEVVWQKEFLPRIQQMKVTG